MELTNNIKTLILNEIESFDDMKLRKLLEVVKILSQEGSKPIALPAHRLESFLEFIEREAMPVESVMIPSREERNAR
jgi:energy-coupling factor transporter ATP-binding protein EcfA2